MVRSFRLASNIASWFSLPHILEQRFASLVICACNVSLPDCPVELILLAYNMVLFGLEVKKISCKLLHIFGYKVNNYYMHTPWVLHMTPPLGPIFFTCCYPTHGKVSINFFPTTQPNSAHVTPGKQWMD